MNTLMKSVKTDRVWTHGFAPAYQRPRWMDPTIGRFTTFDDFEGPIYDPAHMHKYLYGGGDPVNNTDPSGNDFVGEIISMMGIQGVLGQVTTRPSTGPATTQAIAATQPTAALLALDKAEATTLFDDTQRGVNCLIWALNVRPGTFSGHTVGYLGANGEKDFTAQADKGRDTWMKTAFENNVLGPKQLGTYSGKTEPATVPPGKHLVAFYYQNNLGLQGGFSFHLATKAWDGAWCGKPTWDEKVVDYSGSDATKFGFGMAIKDTFVGFYIVEGPPRHSAKMMGI